MSWFTRKRRRRFCPHCGWTTAKLTVEQHERHLAAHRKIDDMVIRMITAGLPR